MRTFSKLHLVNEMITQLVVNNKHLMLIQKQYNTGNLSGNDNRLIFFIIEDVEETILNFSQRTVKVIQFYFVLM